MLENSPSIICQVQYNKENKNILIIEDDDGIRETLRIFFELEDYAVLTAVNGKEGLDFLRQRKFRPDIILLDLMMPVMNGWEFLDVFKKDKVVCDIPVVIITAFGEIADNLKSYPKIAKPIDLDLLIKTVAHLQENEQGGTVL